MSSVHNDTEHSANRSNRKVAPIFVVAEQVRQNPQLNWGWIKNLIGHKDNLRCYTNEGLAANGR